MQRHRKKLINRASQCSITRTSLVYWREGECTFEEAAAAVAYDASTAVERMTEALIAAKRESSDGLLGAWPTVTLFSVAMRRKLEANRHKDGWETGNLSSDLSHLMGRLQDEISELRLSVATSDLDPGAVLDECADVANFAMMIADVVGGLKETT